MSTNALPVWYLMRASGVVALLLLTLAFALGVATSNRWRPTGSRLFLTTELHRNTSLLAVAFLVVHVLTAVVMSTPKSVSPACSFRSGRSGSRSARSRSTSSRHSR